MNEERPRSFDLTSGLSRLLAGEPPEAIFRLSPAPLLTAYDLMATYHRQDKGKHDWRKKALINTLRSGMTVTIASHLESAPVYPGIPNVRSIVTKDNLFTIRNRAVNAFDQIEPITEQMAKSPDSSSVFERALDKLKRYLKPGVSPESARQILGVRVSDELMTRTSLPAFLELIYDVYDKNWQQYPELPRDLTFEMYRDIAERSKAVLFRTAKDSIIGHFAYRNSTSRDMKFGRDTVEMTYFRYGLFQLNKNKAGQLYVIHQRDVIPMIRKETTELSQDPVYDVMRTGCPADVELSESPTEGNTVSLLNTLLNRTLKY